MSGGGLESRRPTVVAMNDTVDPTRASGVTLEGEMTGTAYAEPQFLIGRGGRFVQVSEVLYRIAELSDGAHSVEDIAVLVSAMTRRNIAPSDVRQLIATKLAPAGIIGDQAAPPEGAGTPSSPLAVGLRLALIGPRVLDPLARAASLFFFPGVVLAAVAGTVGARIWLYTQHGIAAGVHEVLYEPSLLLLLGALAVGSAAFHELGHAAALRVAGGRARGMGVGLYLIYPVFYTDVTDSYRLGRWRRLLTDLGGFYFNLVFSLFVLGAYAVTRQEGLLLAVLVTDLEILHQCLPLGRLDGYWVLADLTGVPDFFSQATPFVRRLARRQGTVMPKLRPVARVVFASYLLVIFPVLALLLLLLMRNTPRIAVTVLDSFLRQADRFDTAQRAGDLGGGIAAIGSAILLALPLLAIAFLLAGVLRLIVRLVLRISGRDRRQRLVGVASVAAAAVLLAALWLPAPFGNAGSTAIAPIAATGGTLGDATRDAGVTAAPTFAVPFVPRPAPTAHPAPAAATAPATVPPRAPTAQPTVSPSPTSTPAPTPTAAPTTIPTAAPSATPPPTASPSPSGGIP